MLECLDGFLSVCWHLKITLVKIDCYLLRDRLQSLHNVAGLSCCSQHPQDYHWILVALLVVQDETWKTGKMNLRDKSVVPECPEVH